MHYIIYGYSSRVCINCVCIYFIWNYQIEHFLKNAIFTFQLFVKTHRMISLLFVLSHRTISLLFENTHRMISLLFLR